MSSLAGGVQAVKLRVQKHRDALRPVQVWVPDTRQADFAEQCRRQCELMAQADRGDDGVYQIMDAALADMDGWSG